PDPPSPVEPSSPHGISNSYAREYSMPRPAGILLEVSPELAKQPISRSYTVMDVRLLEAFRAVVDHRSVTAAAGAMGVTQPAVSTQIARLEETIGFALFERSGGRLKPTPEGLLFYAEATRVL